MSMIGAKALAHDIEVTNADAVRIVNLIVGKIDALARPMTIGEVNVVEPE